MATSQHDKDDILSKLKSSETPLFEKCEVIDTVLRNGNLEGVNMILDAGAAVNDVNVKTEALVWCAKEQKLDLLRLVISKGADVNRRNTHDETALMCALENNDKDCIGHIIAAGVDVNMLSKLTSSTVHRDEKRKIMRIFVLSDSMEHVDKIISTGADVNDIDVKNETLYISALEGKNGLIKHLIEKGANVNMCVPKLIAFHYEKLHYPNFHVYESDSINSYEFTPLTAAVQHDHTACVATLLQAGAQFIPILKDSKIPPDQKSKIIQSIARSGSMEYVNMVLDLGADVKGLIVENESLIGAAKEGNLELMKYLITKGASVNAKGVKHGWSDQGTALQTAIQFENYNCVDFLVQAGVAFGEKGLSSYETVKTIESLVKSGNLQYIKHVLAAAKHAESTSKQAANEETGAEVAHIDDEEEDNDLLGAGVNSVNNVNDTNITTAALIEAAKQGNLEVIKYLVNEEGADVNATTMAPRFLSRAPAWILAVENQHPECAEYLIQSGSEIRERLTSLKTSQSDRSQIVQALLQHGNVEYMSMVTDAAAMDTAVRNHALYWAAMKENIELLTALLGKEVDVNEMIYRR